MKQDISKKDLEECIFLHDVILKAAKENNLNPQNVIKSVLAMFTGLFIEIYNEDADEIIIKDIAETLKIARRNSASEEEIH